MRTTDTKDSWSDRWRRWREAEIETESKYVASSHLPKFCSGLFKTLLIHLAVSENWDACAGPGLCFSSVSQRARRAEQSPPRSEAPGETCRPATFTHWNSTVGREAQLTDELEVKVFSSLLLKLGFFFSSHLTDFGSESPFLSPLSIKTAFRLSV